jgi:MFS family permease
MGLFAPVVGSLVDRLGSRTLIFLGTIVVGFGLILLSRTQSLALVYCSFLIIAFGAGGCALMVTTSLVVNWFRKKVSIALRGIIGPTLAGWTFDTRGTCHRVWFALSGLNALALWLIMKMR